MAHPGFEVAKLLRKHGGRLTADTRGNIQTWTFDGRIWSVNNATAASRRSMEQMLTSLKRLIARKDQKKAEARRAKRAAMAHIPEIHEVPLMPEPVDDDLPEVQDHPLTLDETPAMSAAIAEGRLGGAPEDELTDDETPDEEQNRRDQQMLEDMMRPVPPGQEPVFTAPESTKQRIWVSASARIKFVKDLLSERPHQALELRWVAQRLPTELCNRTLGTTVLSLRTALKHSAELILEKRGRHDVVRLARPNETPENKLWAPIGPIPQPEITPPPARDPLRDGVVVRPAYPEDQAVGPVHVEHVEKVVQLGLPGDLMSTLQELLDADEIPAWQAGIFLGRLWAWNQSIPTTPPAP